MRNMKKKETDHKFIRWLIEKFAKGFHLAKNPVRKPKIKVAA